MWSIAGLGALIVVAMWLSWYEAPGWWNESLSDQGRATKVDYLVLVLALMLVIIAFGWYVWTNSHKGPPLAIVVGLILITAALIVVFASAYFYFGGPHNFTTTPASHSGRLSHLDAVSLAVGTLTTAGSAVTPRSQWARALVIIQELTDFAFIGFIAVIAFSRLRHPADQSGRGADGRPHGPNSPSGS